jgi:hypothetical protein
LAQHFRHRLLIVGPKKNHRKQLRQTDGERFFGFKEHSIFLENSNDDRERLRQLRHRNKPRLTCDVITYPLMQEMFAISKSDVEGLIDVKILELILSRNKSEKGVAKIVSITIMRFPR